MIMVDEMTSLRIPKILIAEPKQNAGQRKPEEISLPLGISELVAKILINRGIDSLDQVKTFFHPTLRHGLPDPIQIKNINQAAELILEALQNKNQITIYCDFDVDGLSAGSQLYLFLESLAAKVNYYVPNRFVEGYGLANIAVEKLAQSGTKLLITVDCGVNSKKEITLARQLGLKTVIIDHHQVSEVAAADVIVDPEQNGCAFKEYKLSAAGLVWMLLIVLRRKLQEISLFTNIPEPKDFLDLASLGTICDMVPLIGPNRIIASRGIEAIKTTKRTGLTALKEVAGVNNNPRFNAGHVSFVLGPRINAAGRLSDASEVFELLITKNSLRAKQIAKSLDSLNNQRREAEEQVVERCIELIESEAKEERACVVFDQEFHLGVIGIAAQKLVERYGIPAAVLGSGEIFTEKKIIPVMKGSIRSVKGFDVADVLKKLSFLCLSYGGHEQAGGFSILSEKFEEFKQAFQQIARERLDKKDCQKEIVCDAEARLSEVDFKIAEEIAMLAPFGIGNPAPLLFTPGVFIDSITALNNGNFRMRFTDGKYYLVGVIWGLGNSMALKKGSKVNIVYSPEINTYQGISSVQLNLKEIWEQ